MSVLIACLVRLLTDLDRPARKHGRRPTSPRRPSEAGFTLVELMVVLVIVGLLATVVLVNVLPAQDRAMATKARADIAALEQAMELYRLDTMRYPTAAEGVAVLGPAGGGYVKSVPQDPWGRPYQLAVPGRAGPFDIYSLGADGQPGGKDENADIFPQGG